MKAKLGVSALVLLFLGGLWLVVAPFAVGYQPRGAIYVDATINDLWVGGSVAALAFVSLVIYAADALRELAHRGKHADA
ncbi:SPW repeat protein [Nonomuraea sp. K274]|uniref:SPW repeat protein n=1 Tax=Nonomuraea cypriaca TaxID=1187855 RepID=A0A931ABZ9_9ACTN|nr:SPW repeat protein [Nonomuraea cypriaca]MBF8187319.1 SPW repeat protein [Nonomuraea cypriaca]